MNKSSVEKIIDCLNWIHQANNVGDPLASVIPELQRIQKAPVLSCDEYAEIHIAAAEVIDEIRAEHAAEIEEYEAALDVAETERNKLVAFLEQLQATVTEWEQTSHSNVTKSKCGQIDHKIKVALAQLSRYAPSQSV